MKYCSFLLLCCLYLSAGAQIKISGKVTDTKGQPLPGVNIALLHTYDGATSKANGEYSFEAVVKDTIVLKASFTGFSSQEKKIKPEGKSIQVNFVLKEKISDLKAVVISAGAFEASDEKKGTVLKALDIVTTAGSNGDSYGALKTLPGTQQANDREGLFVRGGTGAETQTFIDGTWVKNAFTTSIPDLGARGRFNPFIFKGTVFSAGGYSALYGQALSSAVILETIDLPERSSANFNLSSIGIGVNLQELSRDKKSSFGIGYNYVNLTPYFAVMKQNIRYKTAPTVHQVDLNYRRKISKSGFIKFYGYLNSTHIDIQRNNIDSRDYSDAAHQYQDEYGVKNKNVYGNFSYRDYLGHGWKINIGCAGSYNQDDIQLRILNAQQQLVTDTNFISRNQLGITNHNILATTKWVIDKSLNNLNAIRFGGEYIYSADRNLVQWLYPSPVVDYSRAYIQDSYTALFAEGDVYLTNELAGKAGMRLEYSPLLGKWNWAPRVSAAYKLHHAGQFSLAYGQFYQKPEARYLLQTTQLNFMRADHYILNYQYQPKDRLLRVEAYYKQYNHLIKTNLSLPDNTGKGYARGCELFYRDKKTLPGIDFWISYSYIDTKRDFLNYLRSVQPDFVASHVASLVFKKFWTRYMFGINGTYTFTSGRPYINYNTSNPNIPGADASRFMDDRTIPYQNFSLSFNYLKTIHKAFTVFVLSINNPFGLKQVYGYNYATKDLNGDGLLYRQAVTPTARQFIFLGMFMSWGIDRSQEAIDNNL